ncbi:FeoA domain-containing protein [Ekhidna sp. MALMAid0563]|uniref:FeoA family protein n=1 Tax=Ekhidna sp. MALMAid0563 TaxID=3143937 RepID=UPI0032DF6440
MSKLSSSLSSTPQTIAHIEESDLKDRLYEMGVYPDQSIEIVRKAPFGDPLIVKVGGQLIMLRQNEADLITIKEN